MIKISLSCVGDRTQYLVHFAHNWHLPAEGDSDAQHTGTVNWFNNAKGFGFLILDGHPDVFCHYSAIQAEGKYKTLKDGQAVEFDVIAGETGRPQAAMVVPCK